MAQKSLFQNLLKTEEGESTGDTNKFAKKKNIFHNILNKIGDVETKSKRAYDPFQCPPNIDLAKEHGSAKKVAVPWYLSESVPSESSTPTTPSGSKKIDVCDCCGLPVKNKPLSLSCSIMDLFFLGPGFPLFFEYIIWTCFLLVVMFFVSGLFNIITNLSAGGCDGTLRIMNTVCEPTGLIKTSLLNKRNKEGYLTAQGIFDFFTVIISLIFLQFFRKRQRETSFLCDNKLITVAEYSVMVSGLPHDAKEEEIKEFFETKLFEKDIKVMKINMSYKIGEYLTDLRQRAYLNSDINDLESDIEELKNKKPENDQEKNEIEREIRNKENAIAKNKAQFEILDKRIEKINENVKNELEFTGTVFITFDTPKEARIVKKFFAIGSWQLLQLFFKRTVKLNDKHLFRNHLIYVNKAPEANDILWENLGYTWRERIKKQILTTFCTFIILGGSLVVIYFLTYLKQKAIDSNMNSGVIVILKLLVSVSICIINYMLNFSITKFSVFEKQITYTNFDESVTEKKVFAQFLNTSLLTFIVSWLFGTMVKKSGLIDAIFFLYISNVFVTPLASILDPFYVYRVYLRKKVLKAPEKCKMTQMEVNKVFEGPPINIPTMYTSVLNILLLGAFYASILPLSLIFSLLTLIVYYFCYKYILIKRACLPNLLGKEVSYSMLEYAEYIPLAFCLGNFLFALIIFDYFGALALASICICCVNFIFPMKYVNKKLFPLNAKHEARQNDESNSVPFKEARMNFSIEYDRINPITQAEATEEWVNFIEKQHEDVEAKPNDFMKNIGLFLLSKHKEIDVEEKMEKNIEIETSNIELQFGEKKDEPNPEKKGVGNFLGKEKKDLSLKGKFGSSLETYALSHQSLGMHTNEGSINKKNIRKQIGFLKKGGNVKEQSAVVDMYQKKDNAFMAKLKNKHGN